MLISNYITSGNLDDKFNTKTGMPTFVAHFVSHHFVVYVTAAKNKMTPFPHKRGKTKKKRLKYDVKSTTQRIQ